MRAAAIFGLGCSEKNLKIFQTDTSVHWGIGLPSAADHADVILLFGGDGTVHRHLSQLVRLGLPVLVVPVGSGNDFARALGLRTVRDSLAAWRRFCGARDNVRAVDLGMIVPLEHAGKDSSARVPGKVARGSFYFCSVAGIGLDAEVSRRANALPRWFRGHGGYALTLLPAISKFAPLPIKISSAGDHGWRTRSDQLTILAAFANTSTYGGGMKIAPLARPDDGLLDVCVIGGIDPFKLACLFPTVYFGGHLKIREVEYFQAKRVCVETEIPLDVYADGEFVCRTPAEMGVEFEALPVICSWESF